MIGRIDVVTLFPEECRTLVSLGVTGRAIRDGRVRVETVNPRDFATDRHRTVDDRPYGGGPGMVMAVEPLRSAIRAARGSATSGTPVSLMSPQGRTIDQRSLNALAARPPGRVPSSSTSPGTTPGGRHGRWANSSTAAKER